MAAIDDLMRVVDEVISASAQCSTAQRNGATWEEFEDDRKHYAVRIITIPWARCATCCKTC